MENGAPPNLLLICRFCLCRDDNCLVPVKILTDSSITLEEIDHFTGILLDTDEDSTVRVCVNCIIKLKQSAEFRKACISKDVLFQQLHVLVASTGEPEVDNPTDTPDNIDSDSAKQQVSDEPYDDIGNLEDESSDYLEEEFIVEVIQHGNEELDNANVVSELHEKQQEEFSIDEPVTEDTDFFYSANYIVPGDPSLSDESEIGEDGWFHRAQPTDRQIRSPTPATQRVKGVNEEQASSPRPTEPRARTRPKKKQRKYLCDTCGVLINDLPRHTLNHSKLIKHACPHCPVEMVEYSNLLRHIEAVHEKRIRKSCELCGKGFTHNNSLVSHMVVHHGIGDTHKCKVCPKVFRHASGLRGHVKKCHSNATKFECSLCGAFFSSRYDLKKHGRSHSSERPYECSECGKRFKSQYARRIHEQAHSGLLYECDVCRRPYRYKALMRMHMKRTHPEVLVENEDTVPASSA